MNSKFAVMFPGADALEDPIIRLKAFQLNCVREKIAAAQNILKAHGETGIDLSKFMKNELPMSAEFYMCLILATYSTQLALFHRLVETRKLNPDHILLIGCSLGDAARTAASDALTFESGLINMLRFIRGILKVQGGAVYQLKIRDFNTMRKYTGLFELPAAETEWSVLQTPVHALVAGSRRNLKTWAEITDPKILELSEMFPFPLHTSLMSSLASEMLPHIESAIAGHARIPMYSSILNRLIESRATLVDDIHKNITHPVVWWQAIDQLHKKGVTHFINVGPSQTLMKFNSVTAKHLQIEIQQENFFEIICNQELGSENKLSAKIAA